MSRSPSVLTALAALIIALLAVHTQAVVTATADGRTLDLYQMSQVDTTATPISTFSLSGIENGTAWNIGSKNSRTATFIIFENRSNKRLRFYWIDYQNNEVHYNTLNAGARYRQPTYATHPWVVRDHTTREFIAVATAEDTPFLFSVPN